MTEHTPGPWFIPESDPPIVRSKANGRDVCDVIAQEPSEIDHANARLIAAAPCLLKCVEHVLIASEDGGDMNDIDFDMLRAAIAKATNNEGS